MLSGINPYPIRNPFPMGNSNRIVIVCQCVFCGIQGIIYERFCLFLCCKERFICLRVKDCGGNLFIIKIRLPRKDKIPATRVYTETEPLCGALLYDIISVKANGVDGTITINHRHNDAIQNSAFRGS